MDLKDIIYVSQADFNTLANGGTITKDGQTYSYDDGNVYAVEYTEPTGAVESVNGQTGVVELDAEDVGALPDDTEIPTKTSDLTNDSNFVSDAAYVHTDTNYTQAEKTKLGGLSNYDDTSVKARLTTIEGKEAGWDAKADLDDIPSVLDDITSTSTTDALSAKQGKLLNDKISNVATRGRFLSLWNCATGLPKTNPSGYPYAYHTGDFFIVHNVGTTNYIPNGSSYIGQASTTVYSGSIKVNDTIFYDGTTWSVFDTPAESGQVQDVYVNGVSVVSNGVAYVIKPTKTSDLTNDSGFLTAVSGAVEDNLASFTDDGELQDSGYGVEEADTFDIIASTSTATASDNSVPTSKWVNDKVSAKENVGKITIGGTEYTVALSTTDAGQTGYITFVVES